jgi:hypothetical protein
MRALPATLALVALSLLFPTGASAKDKPGDSAARWVGDWTAGPEQDITIRRLPDGTMLVEGFATWGASDPDRVASGGVNMGEFSVAVPLDWVDGDQLAFGVGEDGPLRPDAAEDFQCVLQLEMRGEQLMVSDNGVCGGHNVRFDGTYDRTK